MIIPTEPIGSIPKPMEFIEKMEACQAGNISRSELNASITESVRDTILQFEKTVSPVITDEEQGKSSFATYPPVRIEESLTR